MSASKYAHTINEQRYKLLEQLVTKLLHVEQGDENFELARDFCVQKAWFNTFPAVNPRETEAFYADLVARLEADSQTTKASALSALTHKLLALKLASAAGVPDLNHNLLQLLASLSDQPLSSSLDLSPDVLDLLFNPAHRLLDEQQHQQQKQGEQASLPGNTQHFQRLLRGAAARRAAAADAGSMSDEYDPYGDDSPLSDWDEDEGEGKQQQQQQQQQHWGHQPLSADTQPPAPEETLQQSREQHQQEQQQEQQPALTDLRCQPAATTAHASRPGVEQLPYGCVVPAPQQPLAKLQALRQAHTQGTQAASVPPEQQQLCLSEHYLTQQVLRVLQGLPALGFAIKDARDLNTQQQEQQANGQQQQPGSCGTDDSSASASTSSGSASSSGALSSEQFYDVDPRVSTPHMPSHALHALLKDAAAAGTCHRQMRALVQQLAYGSMVSNSLQVTPCLRALGAALQQQLDSMGCQLADLQRQLQQEHDRRRSSGPQPQQQQQGERGLLLRYFRREARPVVARLQLLHCTVFGTLRQLSGPPAAVSAGLIDGLAAAVQAASADDAAGPQVVAGAAALLHLLLSSCVPLSRALAQWLWCAEDSVGALSSGCQQQAGVSVCSNDFFIVRNASRDVAAVHPSFWHKAYGFSTRNTADAAAAAAAAASSGAAANSSRPGAAAAADVCCPAVLAPFVQSIMTAGKSMRLLDYMDQEDLKRSSLCSSSASVGTDAVASGVAQQQQRACALPVSSGGALQRQPSTPRRHRPSSCGGRPGSSSTAAASGGGVAAGQLSRQASFSGRPGIRPAPAAAAAAGAAAQPGKAGSRKKWDAAPQQPASPATAAAALYAVDRNAVARRVGLQLAAAAAMAGQQLIEDELPHEFIRSANYVLQQEQELQAQAHATMQQHKQYLQHCSGHSAPGSSSTPDLLLERLESVAAALARPHALATAGTAAQGQQPSLRDALAAARKVRAADAAVLGGAGHALQCCAAAPRQQQAVQVPAQPPAGAAAAAAAEAPTASADSGCSAKQQDEAAESQSQPAASGSPDTPADISPAAPPAAGADAGSPDAHQDGGSNDAHSSSSSSGGGLDVVPKLTVWRDQVEAKLTSAHQHLQCIAPWQQQQQQQPACSAADDDTHQLSDARLEQQRGSKAAPTSTHASSSRNWLLQTADTKVPGYFTGSLAELWPLKPVTGLKELAASGASWLQGAAWPGCDLEWLLQHPPAHLPAVQQLLWSTLVQPVRTRVELVDRQLMSSLMGEWGMLQQLQGLTNAFLITSPSMVEWVEALFSVVETAKLCAPRSRGSGECSTPSPASKTVTRVGGAGGSGCDSPGVFVGSPGVGAGASAAGQLLPVTVEDLDLCSLEALLQDCILSADPDEVLPDPRALLITLNKEALAELREQQEKRRKALLTAGQPPAAAAAGGAVRQQPAVGLMLCSKEWAGLELQHSGSWQLSLVYTDEQLRFFGQVWRVMLQLRWVRRRVGAQAVAHRSSAAVNDLTARDGLEAAQVAAAVANSSRTRPNSAGSFRQQQAPAFARQPGDAAGAVLDWLTGKEELLLLQEMNQFLSCWHSYVMDGIRVRAWSRLEEVLLSAKSLDQVHSATQKFFVDMCNLCSMLQRDASRSRSNNMWDVMRQRLENLLDHALAAAAAAGRLYAARQKLQELQDLPGREEHVQAWWLELAEARSRLHQAGRLWQAGLGQLLRSWSVLKKNNVTHALDELSDLLDMNGYFRRLERMAALKAAAVPAT